MSAVTPTFQFDVEVLDRKSGKSSRVLVDAQNAEEAQRKAGEKTGQLVGEARKIGPSSTQQAPSTKDDPRRPSRLPVFLSALSLALSAAALAVALIRDPLGKGIDSYDFSTPEAATKSLFEMDASNDLRARIELGKLGAGDMRVALKTFEINKVVDFRDKKIVFASYLDGTRKRRRLFHFEKDLQTKLWAPAFVSSYAVRDVDEKLAAEMEAWEKE